MVLRLTYWFPQMESRRLAYLEHGYEPNKIPITFKEDTKPNQETATFCFLVFVPCFLFHNSTDTRSLKSYPSVARS